MAGLGQSSVPSSDQSAPWNSSQFNMGRSGSIDNHSSIQSKYYAMPDKRTFSDQRLIPEENGVISQNLFNQFNRQQTGFQTSNIMSNEKNYVSNIPTNMNISTGNNPLNYNMYQRNMSESGLYQPPNMDLSSQSKQGFNSNSRMSNMSQYMESSLQSHAYLSPTPHRTISGGTMNPNVPIYNGQNMSSKNRSGTFNFDSNSASLVTHWDSPIGNFDSTDFPSLHKPKVNSQLSQMSGNYNFSLSNKTGQINYQQMVMKPTITPGEHSNEFSIQQEDFPALPVAQNPVSSTETQRSSSATGISAAAFTGSDVVSQSHSSISNTLRPTGFDSMEPQKFHNSYYDLPIHDQSTHIQPASSVSSSISSSNNSSQPNKPVPKKIVQGPNNYITNIPNDMVNDAFGLIGLVKLIGINDTHENLNLLAPGLDTLSLNRELSSNREIYHSYVSPLSSNCAGRPHDMDYPVPKEYRIRHLILDKLADPLPEKLSDETLFWIFYNLTGEECQTTAAKQLMARQWRYNKREKFWLTRDSKGVNEPTVHPNLERGSYIVWDYEKAQRVTKILTVYYKDLENVTPATTKPLFPFCYNSPFIKRSAVNSSAIPPPQMPPTGRTNPKNLATFLQNPSATASVEGRLLNNPISQNFSQPDQMMTSTASQIRVQINNHAPPPPPSAASAIVVSQQQQQSQSTQ